MDRRRDFPLEHHRGQHGSHLRLRPGPEAILQANRPQSRHGSIVAVWEAQIYLD